MHACAWFWAGSGGKGWKELPSWEVVDSVCTVKHRSKLNDEEWQVGTFDSALACALYGTFRYCQSGSETGLLPQPCAIGSARVRPIDMCKTAVRLAHSQAMRRPRPVLDEERGPEPEQYFYSMQYDHTRMRWEDCWLPGDEEPGLPARWEV